MKRPNVLVIWTDQQRWDTIGALGSIVKTPNLDRLAARGTTYSHAFCNSPVCMPSRQSMLSGRYASAHGVQCNGIEMDPDVQCIQHVLSGQGYQTAQLGKLHFKNHASPYRDHRDPHPAYGFDTCIVSDEPGCYDDPYIEWIRAHDPKAVDLCRVDTPPAWTGEPVHVHPRNVHEPYSFDGPEELSHTAFVADITCDYIASRAERSKMGEPFLAIAGIYAPHAPINPPARFLELYPAEEMPLPVRAEGENFADPSTGRPVTDNEWRVIKQHYYALVSHVDDQIGRIISRLEELDLFDETLILFTSDHGEHLGDHGLIQKGHWHDSCTRVPLIVKPPRQEPARVADTPDESAAALDTASGVVADEIVELVDIVPTIADFCGVPTPDFFQGRSLRRDSGSGGSALIEHAFPGGRGFKAIRTTDYLYTHHRDGTERYYDLANDPHQVAQVSPSIDSLAEARREMLARTLAAEPPYPRRTAQY